MQPAVSASLRQLTAAVGAALFVRQGRGLVLSQRGERMFATAQPLLEALVNATLAPPQFDPKTSERTLRIGVSDAMEGWLIAPLMRRLMREAPRIRLVQFRSVAEVLRTAELPFGMAAGVIELFWPVATDDDHAGDCASPPEGAQVAFPPGLR